MAQTVRMISINLPSLQGTACDIKPNEPDVSKFRQASQTMAEPLPGARLSIAHAFAAVVRSVHRPRFLKDTPANLSRGHYCISTNEKKDSETYKNHRP